MPEGGSITGYLFEDFDFENDNGQLVPGQNGPFSLPSNATGTLASGALPIDINVDDDDEEFDDGFQDDPGGVALNQILRTDIDTVSANGTPVQFAAGGVLEVEFTLTATPQGGGAAVDLLFVAVGPGENQGDIFLVVSTAELVPGTTYDIAFANDGGGTPYTALICFGAGTSIAAPAGPRAVESLRPGDLVTTLDRGAQPVRWAGRRVVTGAAQRGDPRLRPIRIRAGALGRGLPATDLVVSPQHRLLVASPIVQRMFGTREILCRAKDLLSVPGIARDDSCTEVTYVHLLLDRHEVLLANGAPAESLHTGPMALRNLGAAAQLQIAALLPQRVAADDRSQLARAQPKGHAIRRMAQRHANNRRCLLTSYTPDHSVAAVGTA